MPTPITLRPLIERGLLVGAEIKGKPALFPLDQSLDELARLAETAGVTVIDRVTQALNTPNPATFIGSGKLQEVVSLVQAEAIDVLLFDDELSPRQQREIERAIDNENVKVLDRTALILDIFAQHASTREGALQVELAQYQYRLPRLTRAWTHLARQAGGRAGGATGGVGVRGPGETQLEIDRREIGRRIAFLQREIAEVSNQRQQYRERRRSSYLPLVALVGYTNAGKSTLLNALSHAEVLVADQLFATLDPTTRRIDLPSGRQALLTDTVGFIQKLPTQLVAAFRATLEEILEADLVLHVVDCSHPQVAAQVVTVNEVLAELGAGEMPMLLALNKIDLLPRGQSVEMAGMPLSALTGEGLPLLAERLDAALWDLLIPLTALVPYNAGELIDLFHRFGVVTRQDHRQEGVLISGRLPRALAGRFHSYSVTNLTN